MMRRLLPTALLTVTGLPAASISGTLLTQRGDAIANAAVVLENADTKAKTQAASDGSGRFAFEGLAAGQYILRAEKSGLAPLIREMGVKDETRIEKGLVLAPSATAQERQNAVAAGTRAAAGQEDGTGKLKVGSILAQNNLKSHVPPVYPVEAKRHGVQGKVELEVAISAEGMPEDIRVLTSPSDDLAESAVDAVRQWRYTPALLNGNPVPIVTVVVVNYSLTP